MRLLHLVSVLSSASLALAWKTFIVPHSGGNDDTPALTAAFTTDPTLTTNTTILFEKDLTYNMLTPVRFPRFENVIISVQGNLSYAFDIQKTQAIISNYSGSWFTFAGGSNVTLEGSEDPNGGWVDSNGQQWWNAMQNISLQVNRPHGWGFHAIADGEIRYMKLWQPVAWSFTTSGSNNLRVHHNAIIAVSNNEAFPFNTDGFSAQGTNMLFENNVVFNGDDCLVVNSPADNIQFRDSYCSGGHGLSVTSQSKKGSLADIRNVVVENVTVENSLYGARFKSSSGYNGTTTNITWKDITVNKFRFPIYVTQNYWDQGLGPKPNSTSANNTAIDTFTFQNFRGTVNDDANYHEGSCVSDPCWYYVPGATGRDVVILDLYAGTARGIFAKNISVTSLSGEPVTVMCDPTEISTDVGFKCGDGPFEPTAAGEKA